jgi:hypothetical protein
MANIMLNNRFATGIMFVLDIPFKVVLEIFAARRRRAVRVGVLRGGVLRGE